MQSIKFPIGKKEVILALGAESAGIFAVYKNGDMFISEDFGDLLDENNFSHYKKAVLNYLKEEKSKPNVVLTDLHPMYNSAIFGAELSKKFKAKNIKVQHHIAHIFSAVGDYICHPEFISGSVNYRFRNKFGMTNKSQLPNTFYGIAMDGTGYGLDGNIWGGEVFRIQIPNLKSQFPIKSQSPISKSQTIRIGSLEEQIMIGGDLAVKEPARMLISILAKIKIHPVKYSARRNLTGQANQKIRDDIYKFVEKFYTRNEFEALYSQIEQNFNCQTTTSTGRILDAVSVLLGFAGNMRNFKHEAVKRLEENSTEPYDGLGVRIVNHEPQKILDTTYLFEYLIKDIHKDKKRLAATAQLYLAKGFYEIIKTLQPTLQHRSGQATYNLQPVFAAGGMANNKIIAAYLEKQGVYLSKKIPRGDEGIAVGQIVYYLLGRD